MTQPICKTKYWSFSDTELLNVIPRDFLDDPIIIELVDRLTHRNEELREAQKKLEDLDA